MLATHERFPAAKRAPLYFRVAEFGTKRKTCGCSIKSRRTSTGRALSRRPVVRRSTRPQPKPAADHCHGGAGLPAAGAGRARGEDPQRGGRPRRPVAGLSGCALVLGDIPSLREIWHGSAIFVPPDHTSGFVNALNGLIENPRRREDFGRRARARAIAFSTHKMTNEYVGAYKACLRVESDAPAARPPLVLEEVAA